MKITKTAFIPIACVLGLGLSAQLAAQGVLEEITVTATKRTTGLQEIPMSITAITGDSLERNGVADFTDVAMSVPSVSFRSAGPGRTKLNIRGISAATGVAPTVSFYLDEMPVQTISSGSTTSFAQTIIDPKMFDLERVEVLRGPQGTLYGSSSMGGTIRLITRQPTVDQFESSVGADVSSTTGGGTNFRLNGMVNVPMGESFALRVVASYTDNDGYFDRIASGDGPDAAGTVFASNVNTEETISVRAALRWEINENSYIQPSIFTQTTEMDGKPNFDNPTSSSAQIAAYDAAEPFDDEFTMVNLTYVYDFQSSSLLASFSTIDREFKNIEDITDGSVLIFDALGMLSAPGFSQELVDLEDDTIEIRLTSSGDNTKMPWVLGFYNKDAVVDAGYRMGPGWDPIDVWDASIACPDQPNCPGQDGVLDVYFNGLANTQKLQEYEETAFFGELTYNFNDSFGITAGLRSLDYKFHSLEENWGFAFNGDEDRSTASVRDATISATDENYKLALTYMFGDDNQAYVSTSTGSRPGAINRVIPRSEDPAEPIGFACNNDLNALGVDDPSGYKGDEVTSTELGLKMTFNDSLRVNAAVYDVTWDDVQQLVLTSAECGNNFTANLGKASSTGLELELTAALGDNATMFFNIGYVDAQFEETIQAAGNNIIVAKGDSLADVPRWTYNVSVDYGIPASGGEYYLFGNVNYVGSTLEVPGRDNSDVTRFGIDSGNVRAEYTVLDLRAGYVSESGWEASIYVDNVTNTTAVYGYNDAIAFAFNPDDPTVRNRPRTAGVSAIWRFE